MLFVSSIVEMLTSFMFRPCSMKWFLSSENSWTSMCTPASTLTIILSTKARESMTTLNLQSWTSQRITKSTWDQVSEGERTPGREGWRYEVLNWMGGCVFSYLIKRLWPILKMFKIIYYRKIWWEECQTAHQKSQGHPLKPTCPPSTDWDRPRTGSSIA